MIDFSSCAKHALISSFWYVDYSKATLQSTAILKFKTP